MARGVAGSDNIPMRLFRQDIAAVKRIIAASEGLAREAMEQQAVMKLARIHIVEPIKRVAPVQKVRGNRKLKHPPGRLKKSVTVNKSRRFPGIVHIRMGGKKAPYAPLLEFGFTPRGRRRKIRRQFFFPTYNERADEFAGQVAKVVGNRVSLGLSRLVSSEFRAHSRARRTARRVLVKMR